MNLCLDAKNVFEKEKNVLEIEGDAIIVGDIHGSFHDLLRILNYAESNSCKIIFLGDYVDRGCFSLECITLLFSLKIKFPNKYYLLRGNHEFDSLCSVYGFKKEILNYHNPKKKYHYYYSEEVSNPQTFEERNELEDGSEFNTDSEEAVSHEVLCDNYFVNHVNMNCYKYTESLYKMFMKTFSFLPLAAVVNKTSLCLHGGLSPLLDKIESINRKIQRPIEDYDTNELLCGILWGDPSTQMTNFFKKNPRGRGKLFSGDFLSNFLKNNGLNRLIRAHECVADGTNEMFNNKCITIFSASSYDETIQNCSGILKLFQKKNRFETISFKPLNRIEKCDAIYYKVRSFIEEKVSKPVFSQFNLKSISSFGALPEVLPRSDDTQSILLDMTGESNEPIQISRSMRMSPSSFKNGLTGKTIAFNTGAQKKRSHSNYSSPISSSSNYFDQFRHNNNSDGTDNVKFQSSKVSLPSLTQKATI